MKRLIKKLKVFLRLDKPPLNPVELLREFMRSLPSDYRRDIWYLMVAMRGPDIPDKNFVLKSFTTCRIRGEVLQHISDDYHGSIVANTTGDIENSQIGMKKRLSIAEKREMLFGTDHFLTHIQGAIAVLRKHVPHDQIQDLLDLEW